MNLHVDLRSDQLDRIEWKLSRIMQHLMLLEEEMALDLSTLTADVAANTDAVASAVTLLDTLAQELRDAAGDPAAVAALADSISANTAALASAVAANTPAAPSE